MFFYVFCLFFKNSRALDEACEYEGTNMKFQYLVVDHFSLNYENSFYLFTPTKNHLFVRMFLDEIGKCISIDYNVFIVLSNKSISFQIYEAGKRVSKFKNIKSPTYFHDCICQVLSKQPHIISEYSIYRRKIEKYDLSIVTTESHFKKAQEIAKAASDVSGFIYITICTNEILWKIGDKPMYLYKRNNGEYIPINGDVPSFFDINIDQIASCSLTDLLSPENNGTLVFLMKEADDTTKQFFSNLRKSSKDKINFCYITNHSSQELIKLLDLEFNKRYNDTHFVYTNVKNGIKNIFVKTVTHLDTDEIEEFISDSCSGKGNSLYISEKNIDNFLSPLTHLTGNNYINFITQENKVPLVFYYNSKSVQHNSSHFESYIDNFWKYASKMVNSSNLIFDFGYINVDMNSCSEPFPYINENDPYLFALINEYIFVRIPLDSIHMIDFFVDQIIIPLLAMNTAYPFEELIKGTISIQDNSFSNYIMNYVYLRNNDYNECSKFMRDYDMLCIKEIIDLNNSPQQDSSEYDSNSWSESYDL